MSLAPTALLCLAALTASATIPLAHAVDNAPVSDDSDLSPRPARGVFEALEAVPTELSPDSVQATPSPQDALSIRVLREDHDKLTPVEGLVLRSPSLTAERAFTTNSEGRVLLPSCKAGTRTRFTATLENDQFKVTNGKGFSGGDSYRVVMDSPCSGELTAVFKSDSSGGQALGIWQVATRARARLQTSIGLAFWRSAITFAWPADGDYYSWGTVHITRGDQWDVVGHEMGHAIYDMGDIGQFGGGPHKIDECYSVEMALSEGWASAFSGWVSISLDDADAKFEYMVPRRAPIRFETIPDDVCQGEKNEWRVNGYFWDLIDLHNDRESMNRSFADVWNALRNSKVRSATEAAKRLELAGFDRTLLKILWDLNFKI
jgi:hypothetical protein